MLTINNNKNIFQVCVNLNDELCSLKESRLRLLNLNPNYDFHYIESEEKLIEFMQKHFKSSRDKFERQIYEVFDCLPNKLDYTSKALLAGNENEKQKIQAVGILVSRIDLFRLAVVYKFGGLYYDLSSKVEIDIEKRFAKYECIFLRSDVEIHTSICYAKKYNFVLKTILEQTIANCLSKPVVHISFDVAGPGIVTNTILNIIDKTKFRQLTKDERIKKLKNLNEFSLKEHNSIIFLSSSLRSLCKIPAVWKRELHSLNPKKPEFTPNCHWHYRDF